MQVRLKEEIDGDRIENYVGVTDFRTDQNSNEINCRECNKTFYADSETSDGIYRSIEQGLESPFLCDDCQRDYEETAYEDR